MKVAVNYDRCEGHAVCVGLAPSVFAISDDDEQVRVIDENPGEAIWKGVILAAKRCPTKAIVLAE